MESNNQNNQPKSNGPGGKRKGAGRKKNVLNVKSREVATKIISESPEGETPLDLMVRIMRRFWDEAEKKLKSDDDEDRKAGLRLLVMSKDAASAAAPYIHAKLASIEVTGKDGKDLAPAFGVLVVPPAMPELAWESAATSKARQNA
jgi:hypothetical protein